MAQNFDSDYITYIKNDIKVKCDQYMNDHGVWENKLNEYISVAKAFGENKILAALKVIGENKIYWNSSIFSSQILLNTVANVADSVDKKVKKQKQNEAYDLLLNGTIGLDNKPIEYRQNELTLFESLCNGRMELVKDKEDMYIKVKA